MSGKEIEPVIPLSQEKPLCSLVNCVLHQANWSLGMKDSNVQGGKKEEELWILHIGYSTGQEDYVLFFSQNTK